MLWLDDSNMTFVLHTQLYLHMQEAHHSGQHGGGSMLICEIKSKLCQLFPFVSYLCTTLLVYNIKYK